MLSARIISRRRKIKYELNKNVLFTYKLLIDSNIDFCRFSKAVDILANCLISYLN